MTIPDELVQAAAAAMCVVTGRRRCVPWEPSDFVHPECALQAAFAKLPECEAAHQAIAKEYQEVFGAWDVDGFASLTALVALAREFGGRE